MWPAGRRHTQSRGRRPGRPSERRPDSGQGDCTSQPRGRGRGRGGWVRARCAAGAGPRGGGAARRQQEVAHSPVRGLRLRQLGFHTAAAAFRVQLSPRHLATQLGGVLRNTLIHSPMGGPQPELSAQT